MGGGNPEDEVSINTGKNVAANLDKEKYEIYPIVMKKNDNHWVKNLGEIKPKIAFLALHGKGYEDG